MLRSNKLEARKQKNSNEINIMQLPRFKFKTNAEQLVMIIYVGYY